jgi:Protein kinase domain
VERGDVFADRYRLDTVLGRGGMGEVWRGFDLRLQRPVAVKVVRADAAGDPEVMARFLREGLAAAQLDHHPAIATVYDAGEHQGQPFLVLELLRGTDLETVLAGSPGGLEVDVVLSYAAQIAEGLAAAHAAGIVHRDIKPSNLVLLPGGQVKICDFGIAHLQDRTTALTSTRQVIGTLRYMAPEQWAAGHEVDERADLYSLGCVVYELLTGQRPFLAGKPPATLPSDLGKLLMRLLAQQPAQRPSTAAAVASDLRAIATRCQKAAQALDVRIGDLLAEVEHIARARSPRIKTGLLCRIGGVTVEQNPAKARRLLAEAERTARTLDDSSTRYELEDIAAVMAALDPAAAAQIAHSLDDPGHQAEVLETAARAVEQRGPVMATQLLADAAQAVRAISDAGRRCGALCQIAEAAAGLDAGMALEILAEAEGVSRMLPGPWEQARALGWWIAKPAAGLDPGYALRLLTEAEQLTQAITDPYHQSLALRSIAQVMAGLDIPEAERIAETVTDLDYRVTGLLQVTQIAAEHDPDAARQLLGAVERVTRTMDEWDASRRLEELAEIAAGLDLDHAESIARSISRGEKRGQALVKTAKGPSQDPRRVPGLLEEAREALGVVSSDSGAEVLTEITEVIAERDRERACGMIQEAVRKELARIQPGSVRIGNPLPELAKGMAKIVNVVARRDLAKAQQIAHTIDDESVRADALRDIAKRIAPWDPAGAVRIAGTLGRGTEEAMVEVIEVIAGQDLDEAERIARDTTFTNKLRQADALLAVASALARQDPYHRRPNRSP